MKSSKWEVTGHEKGKVDVVSTVFGLFTGVSAIAALAGANPVIKDKDLHEVTNNQTGEVKHVRANDSKELGSKISSGKFEKEK